MLQDSELFRVYVHVMLTFACVQQACSGAKGAKSHSEMQRVVVSQKSTCGVNGICEPNFPSV